MPCCPGNGRKRKAPSPASPDVIQLSASSSDAGRASPGEGSGSDMSFGSDAQNGAASPQQQSLRGHGSPRTIVFTAGAGPRKQRAGHPKGVIVVEEGALPERNSEVKRLLRGSRWVHLQPQHAACTWAGKVQAAQRPSHAAGCSHIRAPRVAECRAPAPAGLLSSHTQFGLQLWAGTRPR